MLYYTQDGIGKTIVLVHGFMEDLSMWNAFVDELSQSYHVLCVDLLGHGESKTDEPILTMELQAQAINEVLEKENITEAIMVGHSMGGYITMAFAELFPEKLKGYSLFFSTPAADTEEKSKQRARAAELVLENKEQFIRLSVPNLYNANKIDELQEAIELSIEQAMECTPQSIKAAILGMRDRKDRAQLLASDLPKQMVVGTFDPGLNRENLEKQMAIAKNLVVNEIACGHMGHYEAPEESIKAIKKFAKYCWL
mgnify:CR=1 FL=1